MDFFHRGFEALALTEACCQSTPACY